MKIINFPYRAKEEVIRGVALQVFVLAIVSLYSFSRILVMIMIADFFIRVFITPVFSPLAQISRLFIKKVAKFRKKMIIFKPKRFAAGIGLTMSTLALIMLIKEYTVAYIIILSILGLFSFLEAFFKFCAGCKIFGLLMKLGLIKEDECIDCAFQNGSGI